MTTEFEEELRQLLNRHSIERVADMPDFIMAKMICNIIEAIGPSIKDGLDWHGCDSVCHPKPTGAYRAMLSAHNTLGATFQVKRSNSAPCAGLETTKEIT